MMVCPLGIIIIICVSKYHNFQLSIFNFPLLDVTRKGLLHYVQQPFQAYNDS